MPVREGHQNAYATELERFSAEIRTATMEATNMTDPNPKNDILAPMPRHPQVA